MHPQNRTICDKLQTPPNLRRGEVLPLPAVRCCKFDRTNANTHAPVGADDPVRPAVGTSVFLKPIGKFAIAQRADRGVRPYREFYDFADRMCEFAIASCAGGVEPLPYGVSGNVTFFTICRGKPRKCRTGGQRRPPIQDLLRCRRRCLQFCNCILPGRCGHRPLRGFCVAAIRRTNLPVHSAHKNQQPVFWRAADLSATYFAYSTALVSRMTLTLI